MKNFLILCFVGFFVGLFFWICWVGSDAGMESARRVGEENSRVYMQEWERQRHNKPICDALKSLPQSMLTTNNIESLKNCD